MSTNHDRVRVKIRYADGTTVDHDLPVTPEPYEDPDTKEIVVHVQGKEIRYPPVGNTGEYTFEWYTVTRRRTYDPVNHFMDWRRDDQSPVE